MNRPVGRICLAATLLNLVSLTCGTDDLIPAAFNLNGTWDVKETVLWTDGACTVAVGQEFSYRMMVAQAGTELHITLSFASEQDLVGTLHSDRIWFGGPYQDPDEGTVMVTSTDFTVTGNGARFEGSLNWKRGEGMKECNGSNQVEGTRQGGTNPNPIPG